MLESALQRALVGVCRAFGPYGDGCDKTKSGERRIWHIACALWSSRGKSKMLLKLSSSWLDRAMQSLNNFDVADKAGLPRLLPGPGLLVSRPVGCKDHLRLPSPAYTNI